MKKMFAIPCILVTALLGVGCAPNSMDQVASTLEMENSRDRTIKSFEFLGCAGEWTDEVRTPEVWRTESAQSTRYIARHSDSCGYNVGLRPSASIIDGILDLSYQPTNTSGEAAACLCEYWVIFELAAEPKDIKNVSLNGAAARLKGDLAVR